MPTTSCALSTDDRLMGRNGTSLRPRARRGAAAHVHAGPSIRPTRPWRAACSQTAATRGRCLRTSTASSSRWSQRWGPPHCPPRVPSPLHAALVMLAVACRTWWLTRTRRERPGSCASTRTRQPARSSSCAGRRCPGCRSSSTPSPRRARKSSTRRWQRQHRSSTAGASTRAAFVPQPVAAVVFRDDSSTACTTASCRVWLPALSCTST